VLPVRPPKRAVDTVIADTSHYETAVLPAEPLLEVPAVARLADRFDREPEAGVERCDGGAVRPVTRRPDERAPDPLAASSGPDRECFDRPAIEDERAENDAVGGRPWFAGGARGTPGNDQ
jgi:hypothetical protein